MLALSSLLPACLAVTDMCPNWDCAAAHYIHMLKELLHNLYQVVLVEDLSGRVLQQW